MVLRRLIGAGLLAGCGVLSGGCNAILNSWLDPTVVGAFGRTALNEIRTSLTLEDTPLGIPGAQRPIQADLRVVPREYPISAGDTLLVEIDELRQRLESYQAQVQVTTGGYVNLPVVGRVRASGLTVFAFEDALVSALRDQNILRSPTVTVNPQFLQVATYSIFGIGVSAANNAPLRAGTFPIRRPDLQILEAINQVGGLSEFVTDVYVFRNEELIDVEPLRPAPRDEAASQVEPKTPEPQEEAAVHSAQEAVMDVVLGEAGPPEAEGAKRTEVEEAQHDLEEALEPEPPWMFVNGEFIEHPAREGLEREAPSPRSALPLDTATPAVNWARLAGESNYRIIRIPAEQLRAGNPEMNIIVRAGDIIRIVSGEIGVYYVMGQVNRVGPFAFNAEAITLKAAIAAAGGLSALAWPDRCTIYRRLGQREQMIQVDLDRIFAGKDADFYIKRGDIINVGTHPLAPFLQRIRAWTLPNPASNVGYSYTYARNFADIDSFAVRRNPHNEPDLFPSLFP